MTIHEKKRIGGNIPLDALSSGLALLGKIKQMVVATLAKSGINLSDDVIDCIIHKILVKKIKTLSKAIQIESKKTKREATIRETDLVSAKRNDKIRKANSAKRRFNALAIRRLKEIQCYRGVKTYSGISMLRTED